MCNRIYPTHTHAHTLTVLTHQDNHALHHVLANCYKQIYMYSLSLSLSHTHTHTHTQWNCVFTICMYAVHGCCVSTAVFILQDIKYVQLSLSLAILLCETLS